MRVKQTGFTIIELIVVIALLGILSAVALPRFISFTDEAHDAAVEGAGAGFATGVALLKAQVVANGELGMAKANIKGYGDETLDINTDGYPVGTDDGVALENAKDCVDLWTAIFDTNGPKASTQPAGGNNRADFQVINANGAGHAPNPGCEYSYKNNPEERYIVYDATTGGVSVVLPNS